MEDEHGTYIMNSKDLRAVQYVERLANIGIDSLKIEGRTKSYYYVARTAQIYRQAIDDAVAGKPFDVRLYGQLENLANRGYTQGFYERHPDQTYQNYLQSSSRNCQQQFVGEITDYDTRKGLAEVDVKNRFKVGDELEILLPGGNRSIKLDHMEDSQGNSVQVAPGSGHHVRIPLPNGDYDKALIAVNL
jgi:putative protease